MCFLDFGMKELKAVLQIACRNALYQEATSIHRKDITNSQGLLDYHGSTASNSKCKQIKINGSSLLSFRESSLVGCNATNDRRAKSGLTSVNSCRFCGGSPETLEHIVYRCANPPYADLKQKFLKLGQIFHCWESLKYLPPWHKHDCRFPKHRIFL